MGEGGMGCGWFFKNCLLKTKMNLDNLGNGLSRCVIGIHLHQGQSGTSGSQCDQ